MLMMSLLHMNSTGNSFIACFTSISLGYFIGLNKSSFFPVTAITFWGYICDSEKQAFLLPHDKRVKFAQTTRARPSACPKTLAAGMVDNIIGKLRSIFR